MYLPLLMNSDSTSVKTLVNGDFEQGNQGWTVNSSGGNPNIFQEKDLAQSSSWLAILGGYNNAADILSQNVTITATQPYLHFWFGIVSEDI